MSQLVMSCFHTNDAIVRNSVPIFIPFLSKCKGLKRDWKDEFTKHFSTSQWEFLSVVMHENMSGTLYWQMLSSPSSFKCKLKCNYREEKHTSKGVNTLRVGLLAYVAVNRDFNATTQTNPRSLFCYIVFFSFPLFKKDLELPLALALCSFWWRNCFAIINQLCAQVRLNHHAHCSSLPLRRFDIGNELGWIALWQGVLVTGSCVGGTVEKARPRGWIT